MVSIISISFISKWILVFIDVFFLLTVSVAGEIAGVNFVRNLNSRYISSKILLKKNVNNLLECGHLCSRTSSCVAFNFGKQTDTDEKACELFAEYQKERRHLLQQSDTFDHYFTTVSTVPVSTEKALSKKNIRLPDGG